MTGSPSPLPRLSAPATRALAAAGITDLRQLDGLPEKEILALHGVGPSQLGVLRDAMAAAGHAFADPVARPAPTGRNDNSAFLPGAASPATGSRICTPPAGPRTACGCSSCSTTPPGRRP